MDNGERLTEDAVEKSDLAMKEQKNLVNESVRIALTKNGGCIKDWQKRKTESVTLTNGQRVEVHFYKNKMTDEVNYTHHDFKVKNSVGATITYGIKYKENQLNELLKPRK